MTMFQQPSDSCGMNTMADDSFEALNFALAEYQRYQDRLKAWEGVILAHGGTLPRTGAGNKFTLHVPMEQRAARPRAVIGKMAKIKHFATECIRNSEDHHAHREVIHAYLATHDLHITVTSVCAYLSECKDTFVSDRVRGWTLTEFVP
jgi:hypothetical protein